MFSFYYGTRPIIDPDFWWHLKTGEVMVQIKGLLQSDPFTFMGDGLVSVRETLILKGYWLWQLIAYGLHASWGFCGIFLLNILTLGAMIAVVARQLLRQGVNLAVAAPLLTLGFVLPSNIYSLERLRSFLFFLRRFFWDCSLGYETVADSAGP